MAFAMAVALSKPKTKQEDDFSRFFFPPNKKMSVGTRFHLEFNSKRETGFPKQNYLAFNFYYL